MLKRTSFHIYIYIYMYLYIVQTIILPLIYLFRVRLKKYNMSGAENYECVINVNKYDYRIF